MDIIVKGVLDFVQSQKGRENTVIAGGAVRDSFYNLEPNDYDFCVPSKNRKDMLELAQIIEEEYKTKVLLKSNTQYHESNNDQRLTTVWNVIVEGRKIDLIGAQEENDEDFGDEVIKRFDFGINMVYYNGAQVVDDNENFRRDREWQQMTLINLQDITKLPNLMRRYEKFCQRSGVPFMFHSTCLTLPQKKKTDKLKTYMSTYGGASAAQGFEPIADFEPAEFEDGPAWGQSQNTQPNPFMVNSTWQGTTLTPGTPIPINTGGMNLADTVQFLNTIDNT